MDWIMSLSISHRAGVIIIGLLVLATLIILALKRIKPDGQWETLLQRVKSWWMMAGLFFIALVSNRIISIIFFAFVSFWAFKEFITILDTRRADHRALFWAFLTIPVQYFWVGIHWYGMFIIFIPVYIFLFLPIRQVLSKETSGFLASTSKIQWGLMAFVFGLSHMAFLLNMPNVAGSEANGHSLLLFLVVLTELNDVFQFIWGKSFGKKKILPSVSPNKTWVGFIGGVLTTILVGFFFRFLTPFDLKMVLIVSLVIGVSGFCGDVVMSAVKRDAGVKDFSNLIPGHGGMLDRMDSLCYTAPLFFHIVKYFYYYSYNW